MNQINSYGDKLILAGQNHGADISTQRADDLDLISLNYVSQHKEKKLSCLELGAGRGAQSVRLLTAGAQYVLSTDMIDFSHDFFNHVTLENHSKEKAHFAKIDLINDDCENIINKYSLKFDIITFQRTIHYFTYSDALKVLSMLSSFMNQDSQLFLSASGMSSELSTNYPDSLKNVKNRFSCLSSPLATKHGILAPVCLYHKNELIELCQDSGLHVVMAQESDFGNVKIIAKLKL